VLLSYENEAILAKQNGQDIDYVLPPETLLIENPAAVVEDAADGAQDFLDFITSAEGQAIYAGFGFRPVVGVDGVEVPEVDGANDPADPFPAPSTLFTIDGDFGGWAEADEKFFADGEDGEPVGIIPTLIEQSGTDAQE
jgi:sulfate transport system substrate-binding protein